MFRKLFRAVILGAPASGKGTISQKIVDNFNFVHISPGDILRLNVMNSTALGKSVQDYLEEGKLVPDDLIIKCVTEKISEIGNKSWLLDGFPRTVVQAESLQNFQNLDAVINLKVPDDVIIKRTQGRWVHLSSGRVYNINFNKPKVLYKDDITGEDLIQRRDDDPEIVSKRLQTYKEMIEPVLRFYDENNLVTHIAGNTTAEIWPHVEGFLKRRLLFKATNNQ